DEEHQREGRGGKAQRGCQDRWHRLDAPFDDDEVEAPDGHDNKGEKNMAKGHQAERNRLKRRAPRTLQTRPTKMRMLPAISMNVMCSPKSSMDEAMPATGRS